MPVPVVWPRPLKLRSVVAVLMLIRGVCRCGCASCPWGGRGDGEGSPSDDAQTRTCLQSTVTIPSEGILLRRGYLAFKKECDVLFSDAFRRASRRS